MQRKKLFSISAALLLSVAAVGTGIAVTHSTNGAFMSANNTYKVSWSAAPEIVGEKLLMNGQRDGSKIEVTASNIDLDADGAVVSLLSGGSFENVTGIGSMSRIAVTYRVGGESVNHNGTQLSVLDVSFGYYYNGEKNSEGGATDARIYWTENTAFANEWSFSTVVNKPSFVKFTSTTSDLVKIDKIDIEYGCETHVSAENALNGKYVVGEGSYVKNGLTWNALGGAMLDRNDAEAQYEGVVSFVKGDKFSFRSRTDNTQSMNWNSFTLKSTDAAVYKHNSADNNIEIVADTVNLAIYLKDNGELYLSKMEAPIAVGSFNSWNQSVGALNFTAVPGSTYIYRTEHAFGTNDTLKLICKGEWLGYEKVTESSKSLVNSDGGNIQIKSAGDYEIVYNGLKKSIDIRYASGD